MSYAWRLWLGFALMLSVVLAAMGWISVTAVRLDRAETAARQRAAVDENVRLALWRMDSALAPLLAQESARPRSFYDASEDAAAGWGGFAEPLRLLPAGDDSPYIAARFQYAADDTDRVELSWEGESFTSDGPPEVLAAATSLERLARRIPRRELLERLPDGSIDFLEPPILFSGDFSRHSFDTSPDSQGRSRAAVEFQQRSQTLMSNNAMVQQLNTLQSSPDHLPQAMMTPVWASGEMVLARRVSRAGVEYVQGCLIDWKAMQAWLLEMVDDLLPDARFEPLAEFDTAGEAGLLAALPVRLLPGPMPEDLLLPRSAVPRMLAMAWVAVLLSAILGAALVAGVMRLSQRRGAFVSAVTHELRTPLTTFRLYTEMLAQGMVPDPEAQRQYLHTLRDESLRLSHLVENVLAYARLERGRAPALPEETSLSQLVDPVLPRLHQHAAAEQMELIVDRTAAFDLPVRANPSSVEQILINLIDNACKYANGTADRRICLSAQPEGRYAALRVRDYGPGIPAKRTWYRPFGKSVQEAAQSAPGIGLGLALSRRLAEQMGGRLEVDRGVHDGAALVLWLRRAAHETR